MPKIKYVNELSIDELESLMFGKRKLKPKKQPDYEGCELDIAMEKMQDNETSRGWAIRQANKLRR